MADPFNPAIDGRQDVRPRGLRYEGRARGVLIAARRAAALHLAGDVIVTGVIDEEMASLGTQAICRELNRWRPGGCHRGRTDRDGAGRGAQGIRLVRRGDLRRCSARLAAPPGGRCNRQDGQDAGRIGAARPRVARQPDPPPPGQRLSARVDHPGRAGGFGHIRHTAGYSSSAGPCRASPRTWPRPSYRPCSTGAPGRTPFDARLTRGSAREPFEVAGDAAIVQLRQEHLARGDGASCGGGWGVVLGRFRAPLRGRRAGSPARSGGRRCARPRGMDRPGRACTSARMCSRRWRRSCG